MKKFLLSLFAVLVYALCYGQVLRFTEPTNHWVLETSGMDGISRYTISYTVDTVINGVTYKNCNDGFAYREDTLEQKVYARRIIQQGFTDTIEHTLYDYNLKVGDTLTQYVDTFVMHNIVDDLDSFLLNNHWHKIWHFVGYNNFNVVEGLGCLYHLFEPLFPLFYAEGPPYLVCFYTLGVNPVISIPPYFTNPANCALSVSEATQEKNKISVPNPANTNSSISIPQAYHNGRLLIYDAMGCKCSNMRLSGRADVPFASGLTASGIYYFVVTSADNEYSQRGAFIFTP